MQGRAGGQIARAGEQAAAVDDVRGPGIKDSADHTTCGSIAVEVPLYRDGTCSRRLFVARAEVSHRCCAQPLQRVATDFAADVAFGQVVGKLHEHDGVRQATEAIRSIVEGRAPPIFEQQADVRGRLARGRGLAPAVRAGGGRHGADRRG